MTTLQAFLLGLIQGLTEFLPVSSSGHLALTAHFFGLDPRGKIFFDLVLHMGSFAAVLIYFRREVGILAAACLRAARQCARPAGLPSLFRADPAARGVFFLLLATGVTGAVGLTFQSRFEEAFENGKQIGVEFLLTAGLLALAQWRLSRPVAAVAMNWLIAAVIGLFQALSLLPAISRSGATLTAGLLCKLDREEAFRFAFLLAVPAIPLVFIVKGLQEGGSVWQPELFPGYAAGFISSALTSYLALRILHWFISRRQLVPFILYCLAAGLFTCLWF